jgi:predicted Zn-dependent protease
VLGHELVHATHEHSRRQVKKDMWIQLATLGAVAVADSKIDSDGGRVAAELMAMIGGLAWSNSYGRALEDQADRVGLRYAWEAGYDVSKAPRLWERFAERYGSLPRFVHFFLDEHSRSQDRARKLTREIAWNYADSPATVPASR